MHIVVTGGAGYIGSHTIVELLAGGHDVTVVDNLSNSSQESVRRVESITGKTIPFHQFDLRDTTRLHQLFADNTFDAVMHFAGLKAVGESVQEPLRYYQTNLGSTLSLCECMQTHGVKTIIFSSTATVYGTPQTLPITESAQTGVGITNPYGQTKYMIEQILQDIARSDPAWSVTILRYFNPIGAHPSGRIGEDPRGIPNNLVPFVSQVAVGKRESVRVFGNDYDTPDGTGIRDYIHVVDLARGHVAALEHATPGTHIYNLGTGRGTSVLEIITAYSQVAGKAIPYTMLPRRPGDVAASYADCAKANTILKWKAEKTIADACNDAHNWQSHNPNGYAAS